MNTSAFSTAYRRQIYKTPCGGSRPDIFEELVSKAKYLLAIKSGTLLLNTLIVFQLMETLLLVWPSCEIQDFEQRQIISSSHC